MATARPVEVTPQYGPPGVCVGAVEVTPKYGPPAACTTGRVPYLMSGYGLVGHSKAHQTCGVPLRGRAHPREGARVCDPSRRGVCARCMHLVAAE